MHSHTLARDAFQCVRTVFSDPGREKVKYHDQKRTLFEQLKNGVKKSKTPGEKKHLGNLSKTSCFVHFLANRGGEYFLALTPRLYNSAMRSYLKSKFPLPVGEFDPETTLESTMQSHLRSKFPLLVRKFGHGTTPRSTMRSHLKFKFPLPVREFGPGTPSGEHHTKPLEIQIPAPCEGISSRRPSREHHTKPLGMQIPSPCEEIWS